MNILEEATEIVKERQASYGSPLKHWSRTVSLINTHFGTRFRPEDWGVIMVLDKLARQAETHKRDNLVDVAGYANGIQAVHDSTGLYRYHWNEENGQKTLTEVQDQ